MPEGPLAEVGGEQGLQGSWNEAVDDAPGRPPAAGPAQLGRFLVRGGAIASVGRAFLVLASLATYALVTRALPPESAGLYFLLVSVVSVSAAVGQLGMQRTVVHQLGVSLARGDRGRARAVSMSALKVALLGGLGTAAVLAAGPGLVVVRWLGGAPTAALMVLAGLWSLGLAAEGTVGEVFRGLQLVGRATLFGSLVSRLLLVPGLLALVLARPWMGWEPLPWHVVGCTAAAVLLAAGIGAQRLLRELGPDRSGPGGPGPGCLQLLAWSWPVMATSLVVMAWDASGMWILGSVGGDQAELALFGSAWRASRLVGAPLMIANAVLMPVIAELHERGDRPRLTAALRLVATAATLPALAVMAAVLLWHDQLMGLVFGQFYRDAGALLLVMSVANLLGVLSGASGISLLMSGRQRAHLVLNVISLAAVLGVGPVWTARYGAIGMAAAFAAGTVLQQLLFLAAARIELGVWTAAALDPRIAWRYLGMVAVPRRDTLSEGRGMRSSNGS